MSYAWIELIIFETRPLEYCHMTSEDPKYGREIILKISTELQDSYRYSQEKALSNKTPALTKVRI